MMKKRRIGLLLVCLITTEIAAGQIQAVQARPFVPPLVLLMKGDLWTWTGDLAAPANGTLTQLTHHGYNFGVAISPDGTRVAYDSIADIAVSSIQTDADKYTAYNIGPINIWVWDLTNGQSKRIGEQPGNIAPNGSGGWNNSLLRSKPTWSPDSSKVAWAEALLPDFSYRLVVYDFVTDKATTIVPKLPAPYSDAGNIAMIEPLWGAKGLALYSIHGTDTGLVGETLLFDPQGKQLLSYVQPNPGVFAFLWVTDAGKDYIGLQEENGNWMMIDPDTKQAAEISSVSLEMYNPSAMDSSTLSVVYRFHDLDTGDWSVTDKSGTETPLALKLPLWGSSSLAIAPSGQAVAYSSTALFIWYNGTATQVPGTEVLKDDPASLNDGEIAWGNVAWRLRPLGAG